MNDSLACFQNFYTRARTRAHAHTLFLAKVNTKHCPVLLCGRPHCSVTVEKFSTEWKSHPAF